MIKKAKYIYTILVLTALFSSCTKDAIQDEEPHECAQITLTAYAYWNYSTPVPPGTGWNTTNDTIYSVSIEDDYSSWINLYPLEYCNCDEVIVDFSSSDSLIHFELYKDSVLLASTADHGTRKFLITESGHYYFNSVYHDSTVIWPYNTDTVSAGWPFDFKDCGAAN